MQLPDWLSRRARTAFIGVDFDGTCVDQHGREVPGAAAVLKALSRQGHRLILWTVRSEDALGKAVIWFRQRGIVLDSVNMRRGQSKWSSSPKAHVDLLIDDVAIGTPLLDIKDCDKPVVDWDALLPLLEARLRAKKKI